MLKALQVLETTKAIACEWQSIYMGIQIISNHITPGTVTQRGDRSGLTFLLVSVVVAPKPTF
jgi:hypothetical protein